MTKNQKKERMLWEMIAGMMVLITIIFFAILGVLLAFAPNLISGGESAQSRFGGIWVAGGATVEINKSVDTDAFIGGNRVVVNEPMEQDAFIAGSHVTINAPVEGALRAGGNTVIVDTEIEGNALLMGGTVWLKENARMRGTVNVLANEVIIDGEVDEKMAIGGSAITLNGISRSTVDVTGQSVLIDSEARFAQNTTISAYDITTKEGALGTQHLSFRGDNTPSRASEKNNALGAWITWKLNAFFGSFTIGILLIVLVPRWVRHVSHSMHTKKKATWLHGAIFFLATPTLLFLLAITVIGLPLAVVGGLAYAVLLALGELFAGMMLGLLIVRNGKEMEKKEEYTHRGRVVLQFTVGFAVLSLITAIPVIGWLITLLASVWGAGGIIVNYREWRLRGGQA